MNNFITPQQHQVAQHQANNAIITIRNSIQSFQDDVNLDQNDITNLNRATQIVSRYGVMIQPISLFGRIMVWFTNTRGHRVSAYEQMESSTTNWLQSVTALSDSWRTLTNIEANMRQNPHLARQPETLEAYVQQIELTFDNLNNIFTKTAELIDMIHNSTIDTPTPTLSLNEFTVSDSSIPTTAHNAIIKNIVTHLFNVQEQLQSVAQEDAFMTAIDELMNMGEIPISQKATLVSNCINAVRDSNNPGEARTAVNSVLEGVVVNTRTDESLGEIFQHPVIHSRVVIRRAFNTVVLAGGGDISTTLNNNDLGGNEDNQVQGCISQSVVALVDGDYTTAYTLLAPQGGNCPQNLKSTLTEQANRPQQAKEDLILIWQSYGIAGRGSEARINAHNSYFKRMMVELNTGCTQARKGAIMRHICRIVCIPDPPEDSIKTPVLCLTNVVAILTRAFNYDSTQDNRATQWYSQVLTDTRIVANSVAKNNMTPTQWQQRNAGSPMAGVAPEAKEILDAAMGYGGGRRKRRKRTRRKRKRKKTRRKRKKTRRKSKRRRKKRTRRK